MSTYNGEKFLKKQLQSILNQINVEVRLVIRDDGSNDRTLEYLGDLPQKIEVEYGEKNIGTIRSLRTLIQKRYHDEYLAFADQDDIWEIDHLSKSVTEMKNNVGFAPCMTFPLYRLIDDLDNEITVRPKRIFVNLENSLVENPAIGCGIVLNPGAAEILSSLPLSETVALDQQIYFLMSLLAKVVQGNTIGVNYRLHTNNLVGIRKNVIWILPSAKTLGTLRKFRDAQQGLYLLYKGVLPLADKKGFSKVDRHFNSVRGNWVQKIGYGLKPTFRREKLVDQLLIKAALILGIL